MKVCSKENCNNQTIKRGKYCLEHCTVKKKINKTPIIFEERKQDEILLNERKRHQEEEQERKRREEYEDMILLERIREEKRKEKKLEEDRLILQEQKIKYDEAYQKDLENMIRKSENEKKEKEKKENFENEMNIKKIENATRENDEYYKIKFVFSNLNSLILISSFSSNDSFENIFNFIDIFLYDSSASCDYELISYPNISLNKNDHSKIKISDKILTKNFQLTIKELEK